MRIIVAILVFSFLMLIHELGHFLMAKKLGIRAYELSIGMGPKLFGKKVNHTEYNLRAIPFGAYVRFGDEEDEFFAEADNFMNQRPIDRIKVIIMGPLVNIVAALLLITGVIFNMGFPTNAIDVVSEDMPAYTAGIEHGDKIIQVNGEATKNWENLVAALNHAVQEDQSEGDKTVQLLVKKQSGQEEVKSLTMELVEGRYMIGITPIYQKNILKSLQYGALKTLDQSTMMLDVLGQLFTGRASVDEFSGPVGIVNVVGQATEQVSQQGWQPLILLTSMLSLNLGILNLVPIPGLDGSKILFYGYEAITKKPMNRDLETKLTIAGFMLIIGFSIFITYKDILRLVGGN